MKQRRFFLGAALIAAAVAACGSDPDSGAKTPGIGGDGGPIIGADGQVLLPDGGFPNPGTDAGTVVIIPPSTESFNVDRTGQSGVPPQVVEGLRAAAGQAGAAGGPNGGFNANPSNCSELLYPYESTVMPGGILSPPFMFQNGWDAVYVRAGYQNSDRLDYQFAAPAATPGELRFPAEDWANIIARNQATPMTLTFAFSRGGQTSTCVMRMSFALGNMTGSIYYNTYNHPQSAGVGAVLRLTIGNNEPEMYLREPVGAPPVGPCVGCHSVSADGRRLAASHHMYSPAAFAAKSYDVGVADQPPALTEDLQDAAFGAITPTGELIFRMGNPDCTYGANAFPRAQNNFPLAKGPTPPGLIDMSTGNDVPSSGLSMDRFYWMPQFSPAGTQIVFNDARRAGDGVERRELGIADYDPTSRTFSNQRTLVSAAQLQALGAAQPSRPYAPAPIGLAQLGGLISPVEGVNCGGFGTANNNPTASIPNGSCDGPCYPAWPFFTPDGKGVIFSLISEPDFAVAFPGREAPSKSELWYVDVRTGALTRLDNANKVPGGDAQANYYPTVLPVQVGGYFWVFWTSRRPFGHRNMEPPPDAILGDALFGSSSVSEAFKKRIWVSAIVPPGGGEFSGTTITDPSLPPFYLEGQSNTGNTRAFAALNPCQQDNTDCKSGLDCCSGYCNWDDVAKKGVCGPKITCAKVDDRCEKDSDCCPSEPGTGANPTCIGKACGFLLR